MEPAVTAPQNLEPRYLQWTPVVAGALAATALSLILVTFAATVGLGVSSTAPTWRDASAALWILSGIYLILQAVISFGFGGYIAGRLRSSVAAGPADEVEVRDGLHGLAVWALAVVIGSLVAAFAGAATVNRAPLSTPSASAAEPLLSYELDRLFRSARRPPNVDLRSDRGEAGRILLTHRVTTVSAPTIGRIWFNKSVRPRAFPQPMPRSGLIPRSQMRKRQSLACAAARLFWRFRLRRHCCLVRLLHGPRHVPVAGIGMARLCRSGWCIQKGWRAGVLLSNRIEPGRKCDLRCNASRSRRRGEGQHEAHLSDLHLIALHPAARLSRRPRP
jgi:hypothetical protein